VRGRVGRKMPGDHDQRPLADSGFVSEVSIPAPCPGVRRPSLRLPQLPAPRSAGLGRRPCGRCHSRERGVIAGALDDLRAARCVLESERAFRVSVDGVLKWILGSARGVERLAGGVESLRVATSRGGAGRRLCGQRRDGWRGRSLRGRLRGHCRDDRARTHHGLGGAPDAVRFAPVRGGPALVRHPRQRRDRVTAERAVGCAALSTAGRRCARLCPERAEWRQLSPTVDRAHRREREADDHGEPDDGGRPACAPPAGTRAAGRTACRPLQRREQPCHGELAGRSAALRISAHSAPRATQALRQPDRHATGRLGRGVRQRSRPSGARTSRMTRRVYRSMNEGRVTRISSGVPVRRTRS
jgi:hypothetical protein